MRSRFDHSATGAYLIVIGLCILTAAFFWPTFNSLHDKWTYSTGSYSHGYLILLLCIGLLLRAATSVQAAPRMSKLSLAGIVIAGVLWLLAWVSGIMIVQALLVPLILLLALTAIFGRDTFRTWVFPVGYFLLAVPLWDYGNGILQAMTVAASTGVLSAAGITAYIDGSFVYLASGTFEIAAGCAGQHFFIVGLALSTLYAHLYLKRFKNQVLLVAVTAAAAIVMNWFRVTTIIIAGYLSDMQHYLVSVDHYMYGWVLFAIILVPIYWFAFRLEKSEMSGLATSGEPLSSGTAPASLPTATLLGRAGVAALVLAVAPAVAVMISSVSHYDASTVLVAPESIGPWQKSAEPASTVSAEFPGSVTSVSAVYANGSQQMTLFANLYGRQAQGAELINSSNRLFDKEKWKLSNEQAVAIVDAASPARVRVQRLVSSAGLGRVQLYWYDVAGVSYTEPAEVKIAELLATLRGRPASGIRILAADCGVSCDDTQDMLETTLAQFAGHIGSLTVAADKPGKTNL